MNNKKQGYSDAKGTATNSSKFGVEKTAIYSAEFVLRALFPEMERR